VPFAIAVDDDTDVSMTCRIDQVSTVHGLVLRISGRIATEDLPVVRTVLDGCRVVAIDLAEVEVVGPEVVMLLARAECEGVELRNCIAYIREWITKERESSQGDTT
jgi:hypothetical protein